MARMTTVAAARTDQGKCEKCGKPITKGTGYKWIKPRTHAGATGYKRKRCLSCPNWRPSETTSSPALSVLYAGQEAAEDALAGWDRQDVSALAAVLTEFAEAVNEASQVYAESASNIEDGFGHSTSTSEDIQAKADELEGMAQELENAADELEEWDEDAARAEVLDEAGIEGLTRDSEYDWEEDPEDLQDNVDQAREDWADEQMTLAEDAISNVQAP